MCGLNSKPFRQRMLQLASRFASRSPSLRSDYPLSDDQIRRVAPSIFATPARKPFRAVRLYPNRRRTGGGRVQPFMVAQTRVRNEDRRLHQAHAAPAPASQINGAEANEIVLLNSRRRHEQLSDAGRNVPVRLQQWPCLRRHSGPMRVPHKGVAGSVIEGALRSLCAASTTQESLRCHARHHLERWRIRSVRPRRAGSYDDPDKPAPITESQILMPRRFDDRRPDLWSVFNRTQENLTQGGLRAQRQRTPPANPPGAGHRPEHPPQPCALG